MRRRRVLVLAVLAVVALGTVVLVVRPCHADEHRRTVSWQRVEVAPDGDRAVVHAHPPPSDGCWEHDEVTAERDGSRVIVSVWERRIVPEDAFCTLPCPLGSMVYDVEWDPSWPRRAVEPPDAEPHCSELEESAAGRGRRHGSRRPVVSAGRERGGRRR